MNVIRRKMAVALHVFKTRGIFSVLNVAAKKVFPSDNVILSWESRILFRCTPKIQGATKAHRLTPEEMPSIAGVNGTPQVAIDAAVARGEHCWVIREGTEVVAYAWISGSRSRIVSDTGYEVTPDRGSAYWWRDVYVAPEFRGRHLPAVLLSSWLESIPESERGDLYTEVAPDNTRSLAAHRRLGFEEFATLNAFCILGARFYMVRKSHLPPFAFRFFPRNVHYSGSL